MELHPNDPVPLTSLKWTPPGAIPPRVRSFGKYFDTSDWLPGDLILTREIKPDFIGTAISKAQIAGGYSPHDSLWTHAAMYLGDDLTLCEATFSLGFGPQGVVNTYLWDYCGDYIIKVRRPKVIQKHRDRWLLALKALTQIKKDYDFLYVINLAWLAYRGNGFWNQKNKVGIHPRALVCSTLYADAYASQTKRVLGENGGICTPAFLSQSADFDNIKAVWRPI